jgi:hypothetical protein
MMDPEDEVRRAAMLDELRSLAGDDIPPEAITVAETQRLLGTSEDQARDWLNNRVRTGRWVKAKRGAVLYYWIKRDEGHD